VCFLFDRKIGVVFWGVSRCPSRAPLLFFCGTSLEEDTALNWSLRSAFIMGNHLWNQNERCLVLLCRLVRKSANSALRGDRTDTTAKLIVEAVEHYYTYTRAAQREDSRYQESANKLKKKRRTYPENRKAPQITHTTPSRSKKKTSISLSKVEIGGVHEERSEPQRVRHNHGITADARRHNRAITVYRDGM